jgi:hypothetical protein
MKVTMEEQKLYDDFTVSVFQRGYEKGKEDATISYQNAYNEGHVDGYAKGVDDRDSDIKSGYMNGYNKGLNDAWECAKKITNEYTIKQLKDMGLINNIPLINSEYEYSCRLIVQYSASEAIFAIKEYEDKHKCKECKWDEFRDAQSPVGTPCDSCFEGKNFSPKVARCCSVLDDICPYDIKCEECEVHCSVERAKQKLKGDKE